MSRYSRTRWEKLGYRVQADASPDAYVATSDGDDYAVYDYVRVEPISGAAAQARREQHCFDHHVEHIRMAAQAWWQSHPDASIEQIQDAAYDHTHEVELRDPFGEEAAYLDKDDRQWFYDEFERAALECQTEWRAGFEDTLLLEYEARHGYTLYRSDDLPAGYKTAGQWYKAGYFPIRRDQYTVAVLEYDGTLSPVWTFSECTERYGEGAAECRKLYLAVISRKVKP